MKRSSKKSPSVVTYPDQPVVYKSDCCNQPINVKTSGATIRGVGAATKGTKARGPMA
jgi:hypothetical protein